LSDTPRLPPRRPTPATLMARFLAGWRHI
jgi:hypothetical protein